MAKTLNILLTNCPTVNGNRGCVALSLSALALIDQLLRAHGVEPHFCLPQSGHMGEGTHRVVCGGQTLTYRYVADVSLSSLRGIARAAIHPKATLHTIEAFRKADYVLDIGQGDSFSDIYGKARFDWIFSSYEMARRFQRPFCILPQTIGPFANDSIRLRAAHGITRAESVMARDKSSAYYVRELAPEKPVHEIIDVAFFLPYKAETFTPGMAHVGLNVSALLWHGGYERNNQFGLKSDYPTTVRAVIDHFLKMDNVMVHLVPHVVETERSVENDYATCYDLYHEYASPRVVMAPFFLDPMIAKGYIAGLNFFMGARMHSTIGAFSAGVPVVPMAYSRKFGGLFCETLRYPHLADLTTDTTDETLAKIDEAFAKRDELKAQIADRMTTIVAERKAAMMAELARFFHL